MKKLFFILLAVGILSSCQQKAEKRIKEKTIETITIEGCEYIIYNEFSGYIGYGYMAHKGNCKSLVHKK